MTGEVEIEGETYATDVYQEREQNDADICTWNAQEAALADNGWFCSPVKI